MISQWSRNPYSGWKREIVELMSLDYLKDRKKIKKINQAYKKVVKEHSAHVDEIKKKFEEVYVDEIENIDEGKPIFLVMSFVENTLISRAIVTYTESDFSHVAISLDASLNNMYSFSINAGEKITNLRGGFTYESIRQYQEQDAMIQVNCIPVSSEQYEQIQKIISEMAKEKKKTNYNLKGLIRFVLNEEQDTNPKDMFCSEFIVYIFRKVGICLLDKRPEFTTPQDLANIASDTNVSMVYRGKACCYRKGIRRNGQ